MQGPQVYSVYEKNGWSKEDIAKIYSTGYISGALCGLLAGPLADTLGRKYVALLHPVAYGIGCIAKYQPNFLLVIIGRTFTGFANAILATVFEPWLVNEANQRQKRKSISGVISIAVTGNSFLAIIAGVITELSRHLSMPDAPFWLSLTSLSVGFVVIASAWSKSSNQPSNYVDWRSSVVEHLKDPSVVLLGFIQSFFEAAMYFFVFMWTPTLQKSGIDIPHGLIFSSFMSSIMIGSNIFRIFTPTSSTKSLVISLLGLTSFTSFCLYLPVLSQNLNLVFIGFLLFEFCCGLFWPLIGILRARIYHDRVRSTIQTIFRIPFNIIVGCRLIFGNTKGDDVFATASCMLAFSSVLAAVLFVRLYYSSTPLTKSKSD